LRSLHGQRERWRVVERESCREGEVKKGRVGGVEVERGRGGVR